LSIEIEVNQQPRRSGAVLGSDGDDILALVEADGEFTAEGFFIAVAAGDRDSVEEDFGGIIGRKSQAGIPEERWGGEGFAKKNSGSIGVGVPNPVRRLSGVAGRREKESDEEDERANE